MANNKFEIKLDIDTKQIDAYQKNLLRAYGELNNFEERFLNTLANLIIRKAMPITPVKTGRLRRSYKVTKVTRKGNDVEIEVYNNANTNGVALSYASYVEFGHFTVNRVRWIEGRFMLTIATDEVEAEMQRVWDILFNKWSRRMGL